jgi:hypothetical protein
MAIQSSRLAEYVVLTESVRYVEFYTFTGKGSPATLDWSLMDEHVWNHGLVAQSYSLENEGW